MLYHETRAKWVNPVKKAILKYDEDGDGSISAFEIASFEQIVRRNQVSSVESLDEVDAAAAELNAILRIVVT